MLYLVVALVALVFGAGIVFLFLRPKHKQDIATALLNQKLQAENEELRSDKRVLEHERSLLRERNAEALQHLENLNANIAAVETQSIEAGNQFYQQSMELARQQFQQDAEQERLKYEAAKTTYAKDFLQLMEESAASFVAQMAEQDKHCAELRVQETELQSIVQAAVAAAKRAEEIKTQADFYKLQLSEADIEEIRMLRNIAPYLRDQEPLNKVIWKVYYEKPTSDLVGRVVGSGIHTGIYKITNLDNDKCYVGQAANLAERWKQHIKRGVGAETPTRNKLYPAMLAIGVEHFSFEVIEECGRDQLDAREDYWQDYFKAKEFGYSIK